MTPTIKALIKGLFRRAGYELRPFVDDAAPPGSPHRPLADLRHFLEDLRARNFFPKRIVDGGANRGDWTRMAARVWPDAEFLLIEPQMEMKKFLEALHRENPRANYVMAAVGKEAGELILTIWDDLNGSSFLPPVNDGLLEKGKQRPTPVVTIDELVETHFDEPPDLLKLDIQGFEIEALKGATECLGKTELFILETSLYRFLPDQPLARDIIDFMGSHGYEIYDLTDHLRRPLDGALGQLDMAFARRDGFLRRNSAWSSDRNTVQALDRKQPGVLVGA